MLKDTERLLLILHRLLAGPCTAPELLEYLSEQGAEIVVDTLYRDIQTLRRQGYRIPKATRKTQWQYLLQEVPFHLPFSEMEIQALTRAEQILYQEQAPDLQAFQQALERLSPFLTPDLQAVLHKEALTQSRNLVSGTYLHQLQEFCEAMQQIELSYLSAKGHRRKMVLEPHDLLFMEHHWYLIAYDIENQFWLELRVERIQNPIVTLPRRKQRRQRRRTKALFRLYGHVGEVYQLRPGESSQPDPERDGALLVRSYYESELRFCQRLLRYEEYAEILEPKHLRERMHKNLSQLLLHYSDV